jgi:hypothetical protein
MLARNANPTNTSPFHFKGLEDKEQQQCKSQQLAQETNRERTFRRAGNACEIAAGTALNSTIIFTFHLLQVHPMGLLLAVGTCHFYFTATAIGEKSFSVAMIGGAASLSCLCALSEPVGEWWESRISVESANQELAAIYQRQQSLPSWTSGFVIAVCLLVIRLGISRKMLKGK